MEKLIVAATISFGLGAFGFVLFRFFLLPIRRYGRIKSDIRTVLFQAAASNGVPVADKETVRKLAAELSDCYHNELPVYYRLQLTRRQEQPIDASRMILSLAGIRQPEQVQKRIAEIRTALRIQAEGQPGSGC